ncbi:MAG: lysoplasmalogenase family protein [Burkholderiaceae bacterium]
MTSSQIIVLATPVFLLLIGLEFALGRARGRQTYRLADAVTSIGLGMLSQVSAVFTRLLRIGIYTAVHGALALFPDAALWDHWSGWLLALVFYDFCYYWHHRLGHESAVFWAAHVVHHQSEDYNLSTALRQTSSGALLGWLFYLPMAVAGVPPLLFAIVALVDLLYQYWIHTQQIGRLGWFDRVFASPSNHRVHHAVNDAYLDRNYGGILILWDRLFGTFIDEDPANPCIYGTRKPLRSWDPLWANLEVYWALARDSWRTRHWGDKLRVWLKPPGWQPADLAARAPAPGFDVRNVRRFEPPMGAGLQWFSGLQFLALLSGVALYLWHAEGWPMARSAVWFAVLLTGLWAVGAAMQGRLLPLEVLVIEAGALSMATAADGWREAHLFFKPAAMVLALWLVAQAWRAGRLPRAAALWLSLALAGSLAGDVALMLPGLFVPGLASFLVAHLAYIVLFRQDSAWWPDRRVLLVCLGYAALMVAVLWTGGLPAGLRLPVSVYALAIGLMAAQAVGRARAHREQGSTLVALGAIAFIASDTLLAINRFVSPLPASAVWVLSTYYAAQCLIVGGTLRRARRSSTG